MVDGIEFCTPLWTSSFPWLDVLHHFYAKSEFLRFGFYFWFHCAFEFFTKSLLDSMCFLDHGYQFGHLWGATRTNEIYMASHSGPPNSWGEFLVELVGWTQSACLTIVIGNNGVISCYIPTHGGMVTPWLQPWLSNLNCKPQREGLFLHLWFQWVRRTPAQRLCASQLIRGSGQAKGWRFLDHTNVMQRTSCNCYYCNHLIITNILLTCNINVIGWRFLDHTFL